MADIILAEDTENIREGISSILAGEFHTVRSFTDGNQAFTGYRYRRPDLLILDVMMPGMDGIEVTRKIRNYDTSTPILILSAKISEEDRVIGLEQGADDYLCKPFGIRELIARINALLRRHPSRKTEPSERQDFDFGSAKVSMSEYLLVTSRGRNIHLSRIEVQLLRVLADNPGRIISRKEIFEKVWQCAYLATSRTLDTHLWKLRQKIGTLADRITTIPTLGFRYTP